MVVSSGEQDSQVARWRSRKPFASRWKFGGGSILFKRDVRDPLLENYAWGALPTCLGRQCQSVDSAEKKAPDISTAPQRWPH